MNRKLLIVLIVGGGSFINLACADPLLEKMGNVAKSDNSGNTTYYYDSSSHRVGKSVVSGNTITYYDAIEHTLAKPLRMAVM